MPSDKRNSPPNGRKVPDIRPRTSPRSSPEATIFQGVDQRSRASNILDAARMQWQFGDWDSLTTLSVEGIQNHPDRAKLALLLAAAWLQKDDRAQARENLKLAISWGCDKRTIARILIATTHITLGRAAALQNDEHRALEHFRNSVTGVSGDARLACQARSTREFMRLGLAREAARFIQEHGIPGNKLSGALETAYRRPANGAVLAGDRRVPSFCLTSNGSAVDPNVILVAGMRHSGSTALFNVIRLALKAKGLPVVSGYAEYDGTEQMVTQSSGNCLIKIHEYRDDLVRAADVIFTTRRDLRDSVASAARRDFPVYRAQGGAVGYAKYNRSLYEIWSCRSHYEFVYERFMRSPLTIIEEVLKVLGIETDNAQKIFEEIESLPTDDYKTTLLSPVHITDPERIRSYTDTLAKEEVEKIEKQHFEWLLNFDYPISRQDA